MKLALKFISTVLLGLLFVSLFAHAAANPDVLASARETWMVALKAGDAAKTSSVFTADAISIGTTATSDHAVEPSERLGIWKQRHRLVG